ncbi:MAG: hypothetical protein H6828_12490 [Planctomycetes bacterium]|nr:hypothetical protein [Planctomycetota bacterium]
MRRLLLTLAAACAAALPASAQSPFDQCGTFVQGVTCPMFFQTGDGQMYLLDTYGGHQLGDTARVQGDLDTGCFTICLQGNGCIAVSSITSCQSQTWTTYCYGDGSGTPCPCGNGSTAGEGCQNSSGLGGRLDAAGSDSITSDDLQLSATQLLPNQPVLLFSGSLANNGGNGVLFGDGLRCAGGAVLRHGVQSPNASGQASWPTGLAGAHAWGVGTTRYFQGWYRDPVGSPCGASFNLTQGLQVTFTL